MSSKQIGPYSWRDLLVLAIIIGLGVFLVRLDNSSWHMLGVMIICFTVSISMMLPFMKEMQREEKTAREHQELREKEFASKYRPEESYITLRQEILKRDGYRCRQCGSFSGVEVHHIKRRLEGGSDTPENLITLCYRCHDSKHPGAREYYIKKYKREKRQN